MIFKKRQCLFFAVIYKMEWLLMLIVLTVIITAAMYFNQNYSSKPQDRTRVSEAVE